MIKICKICEVKFTDKYKRKYCSDKCLKKSQLINSLAIAKKRERGYKAGKVIGKCSQCSEEYKMKNPNQRFCSEECREEDYNLIKTFKKEPKYGDINFLKLRFKVFVRDNFTCQYCGRNVAEDKIKLNADHIFPRSEGGKDIIDNLRTSCVECNLGKRCEILNTRGNDKNE